MKRIAFLVFFFSVLAATEGYAQRFALKTDVVKWATASFNLEPEVRVGKKSTVALALSYNPWTFGDNRKWKHLWVQPEYRYWLCAPFSGHFIGGHILYTHYNAGNVDLPFGVWSGLEQNRYQGDLVGAGFVYGYHWMLTTRFSLEAAVGIGYGFTRYKYYECPTCGAYKGTQNKHLLMPTRAAISLVYVLK